MNVRIMTLALIAVVSVCAACQGNPSPPLQNAILSEKPLPGLRHYPSIGAMVADAKSLCPAAPVKVPGSYVFMNGGGFLGTRHLTSTGLWFVEQYVLVTPGPTPTPGVTPTPNKSQPVYFYYGTYALKKHKQTGCTFVTATQSGKPFGHGENNAIDREQVVTSGKYVRGTYSKEYGILTVVIDDMSATGGHGSVDLGFPGKPGGYDSGPIVILGRISIP